ncbi:hypothetical protein D3C71_1902230 [compost metagenome]
MQGIHEDARIGRRTRPSYHIQRGTRVRDGGPRHELQVGGQAAGGHGLTQSGVGFGQPIQIGVVTGNEHCLCTESSASVEQFRVRGGRKVRSNPDDFEIQHPRARVALHCQ